MQTGHEVAGLGSMMTSMSNNNSTNHQAIRVDIGYTDGAPLAADDPRVPMARSVQAARAVIALVDADNARATTPCADWNVLQLARHIVAVLDRVAAAPTGQVLDDLPMLADVGLDELDDAAMTSARNAQASWSSDDTLSMLIDVPWGTFPGAAVIGAFAAETLVHTWDLAVAIGVELNWPDADLAIHFQMVQIGIPESPREEFMPFDPVVRPGEDAPLIEHLAGWQGRDVDRWRVR